MTPTLTEVAADTIPAEVLQTCRNLRGMLPFRIVYAAQSPAGEWETNAVATMARPNRLAREGYRVFRVR